MKFYFAGYTTVTEVTQHVQSVLNSYLAYKGAPQKLIDEVIKYGIKDFFLDSGAFTAFTQGTIIKVEDYTNFCLAVKDYVSVVANLDVIGDSEATYKNWLYMREHGVQALPVIHYGAEDKWFDIYLNKHKQRYVALGGLVPYARQPEKLRVWLDHCYFMLKPYWPVKTHLFGILSPWALKRYPAYSADGTSWLAGGKYGSVMKYKNLRITQETHQKFYAKTKDYRYLGIKNALTYVDLNNKMTDLWKMRGIEWKD